MIYSKETLRQIFQQPFNEEGWQNMLWQYFHATELKAERERINDTPDDEKGYYLGALDTSDSYRIGLFYYQIQRGNVARKRVGLRNLVKSFINPNWGEFDAALVVFDSGSVWRLSFVCDIKGENTAAKRFTYVFGESDNYYNTPVGRFDALQRNGISFENIKDAFSVERLNKDFFNGYKERYVKFLKHINDDTKENRDYVKKLLGRLVFLQFLQKKGWMGVPANQQGWNGGDKFYLNHLIERYEGNDRLLSDVLEPLFFNTLNERRINDLADPRLGDNVKIPYLNGGLFDKDELDKKDIDFPYDYFKELMDFFAMYNFTIDENDPEDSEIGIDPEMLGHIFENLLEDNKDKGAFYTPKEIVQYMSQESVAQYLKSHAPEELHTAIDSLIKQRVVEPLLQNKENARLVNKVLSVVKVGDPAIGSGAFPMGVLNVLFDCRHLLYGFIGKNEDFSYAKVKRDIIQNNIYGVDIEKGAVDIARLRFWLALVVDEYEPQPLPNLDYKIMCGDSLLHRFALDAPFQNVLKDYNQKNGTHYTLDDYRQWVYDYTDISDHTQKDDFRKRIEDIKRAVKTELSNKEKGKIAKVRGAIANLQMGDFFGDKKKENERKIKALQKELKALEQQRAEIESNKIYDQAFEWRFEFPALLDEKGDFVGFDIVIGNPPYGVSIKDQYRKAVVGILGNVPDYEIYYYFIQIAEMLLVEKGIMSYIIPNTYLFNNFAKNYRLSILDRWNVLEILDCTKFKIFESATVFNTINTWQKNTFGSPEFIGYRRTSNITSFAELLDNPRTFLRKEDLLKMNQNWGLAFFLSDKVVTLINKLSGNTNSISNYYDCSQGYIPYRLSDLIAVYGKEEGTRIKTQRLWHSKQKTSEYYIQEIYGRDISKYDYSVSGEFIKYGKHVACYVNPIFFTSPRLLVREITNPTIIACFITDSYINDPQLLPIIAKDGSLESLYYLWGILNSKLATFYHFNHSPKATKGAFPKILVQDIKDFPLPVVSNDVKSYITELVKQVLENHSKGLDTKTGEQQIDLLVYHLYNMTYDEVLIVDPDTPITRDEYEKKQN